MIQCPRCKTGKLLQNFDEVVCYSCGYETDVIPIDPTSIVPQKRTRVDRAGRKWVRGAKPTLRGRGSNLQDHSQRITWREDRPGGV